MGIFFCKRPVIDLEADAVPYEKLCDALTKWHGEPATFAHVIYPNNLSASFVSEVVEWKVCGKLQRGYEYVEWILKFNPWNKTRGLSFRSETFFKNEIAFYETVLPEFVKFQSLKKLTEIFDNHVKICFTHNHGENFVICSGNEHVQGFENAKVNKMDVNHGKLTLKSLAKFHALSFAMKEQDLSTFERVSNAITETLYSAQFWGWYKKLWGQICAVVIDSVEKEYPNTIYVDKIRKFANSNRFKDLVKAVNAKENAIITHSDCTTSNYLFKYVDDIPVDVKILDFQQVRCSSPVLDIASLLYANTELLKNYDELLEYYHEVLSSQIRELGSNPDIYSYILI